MKKVWKGALIGGIIGGLIGLIGFTSQIYLLSYFLLPLWIPLLFVTEGLLGIELEGSCTSFFCKIPFGFFTTIYFCLLGVLISWVIIKIWSLIKK